MLDIFWEKIGQETAKEWNSRLLTPALIYWIGALLAYNDWNGWSPFLKFIEGISPVLGVAFLSGALVLLVVSTSLIHSLTFAALRLLEGYWPWPFSLFRVWITKWIKRSLVFKQKKLGVLAEKFESDKASSLEVERYAELDSELDTYPVDNRLVMPTRLGNLMRSAEEYPYRSYGLEITTTWPRLWLVMPEKTQKELVEARQAIDRDIHLALWGLAFFVWSYFTWWAVIPAILVTLAGIWRISASSGVYAQLIRSAYDLYRFDLYQGLHWPLPVSPAKEKEEGEKLTIYLKRNFPPNDDLFEFSHPSIGL